MFSKLEELRTAENEILEQKNIVLSKEEVLTRIESELKDIVGRLATKDGNVPAQQNEHGEEEQNNDY